MQNLPGEYGNLSDGGTSKLIIEKTYCGYGIFGLCFLMTQLAFAIIF